MHSASAHGEGETRRRLLDAAGRLFAERGFKGVSVREICKEAGVANVAAVNYYFRDKAGLYREVLEYMVEVTLKVARDKAAEAMKGKPPEEKLHVFIRLFLNDVLGAQKNEKARVLTRLMNREMVDCRPEFRVVVEKGWKPRFHQLSEIVGEIVKLPAEDQRVSICAMNTLGPCLTWASAKQMSRYFAPRVAFTPEIIEGIVQQVTAFALAGIRAVMAQSAEADRFVSTPHKAKAKP